MEQRRVRRGRTAQEWQSILAEQASSGLSQTAFCRGRGITISAFYNAKARLKSKSTSHSLASSGGMPGEFIGISLDAMLAPQRREWDVELSLGEGMVLRIRRPAGSH